MFPHTDNEMLWPDCCRRLQMFLGGDTVIVLSKIGPVICVPGAQTGQQPQV